jgi:hypothetical protein
LIFRTGQIDHDAEYRLTFRSITSSFHDRHRSERGKERRLVDLALLDLAQREVAGIKESGEVSDLDWRDERSVGGVLVNDLEAASKQTFS